MTPPDIARTKRLIAEYDYLVEIATKIIKQFAKKFWNEPQLVPHNIQLDLESNTITFDYYSDGNELVEGFDAIPLDCLWDEDNWEKAVRSDKLLMKRVTHKNEIIKHKEALERMF